jgi:hypothetical protein
MGQGKGQITVTLWLETATNVFVVKLAKWELPQIANKTKVNHVVSSSPTLARIPASHTKPHASPRIAARVDCHPEYPWALQCKLGLTSHLLGNFSPESGRACSLRSGVLATNPRKAQPLARRTPQHQSHQWRGSTLRGCDVPCIQLGDNYYASRTISVPDNLRNLRSRTYRDYVPMGRRRTSGLP